MKNVAEFGASMSGKRDSVMKRMRCGRDATKVALTFVAVLLVVCCLVACPCRFADATLSTSTQHNSRWQNDVGHEAVGVPQPGDEVQLNVMSDSATDIDVRFSLAYELPDEMSIVQGKKALHKERSCRACDEMRDDLSSKTDHAYLRIVTTPDELSLNDRVVTEDGKTFGEVFSHVVTVSVPLSSGVDEDSVTVYECNGKQGMSKLENEINDGILKFTYGGKAPVAISYVSDDQLIRDPTIVVPEDDYGEREDDRDDDEEDKSLLEKVICAGCEMVSSSSINLQAN